MADYPPYMNAYGRIKSILTKIQEAKTPPIFSQDFLTTTLGAKGGSALTFIGFAKRIGLLEASGAPTEIYKQFRNPEQSKAAMAVAIRKGYADIYTKNEYAHKLDPAKLEGIVTELTGLEAGHKTIKAICASFNELKKFADFDMELGKDSARKDEENDINSPDHDDGLKFKMGLSYTINLVLPKTDDVSVFNAIFKSLRDNLLTK